MHEPTAILFSDSAACGANWFQDRAMNLYIPQVLIGSSSSFPGYTNSIVIHIANEKASESRSRLPSLSYHPCCSKAVSGRCRLRFHLSRRRHCRLAVVVPFLLEGWGRYQWIREERCRPRNK